MRPGEIATIIIATGYIVLAVMLSKTIDQLIGVFAVTILIACCLVIIVGIIKWIGGKFQ